MGGGPHPNGITLSFYDPDGNPDSTRSSMQFPSCWITSRPPTTPGIGSEDWIKEIYLAPDPPSLYVLMRAYPPTGSTPPFTTAASKDVTVNYVAADGTLASETWKSAIGEGTDEQVTLADGSQVNFRLFDTLKVTQGDAAVDIDNHLYPAFQRAKPFLPPE